METEKDKYYFDEGQMFFHLDIEEIAPISKVNKDGGLFLYDNDRQLKFYDEWLTSYINN